MAEVCCAHILRCCRCTGAAGTRPRARLSASCSAAPLPPSGRGGLPRMLSTCECWEAWFCLLALSPRCRCSINAHPCLRPILQARQEHVKYKRDNLGWASVDAVRSRSALPSRPTHPRDGGPGDSGWAVASRPPAGHGLPVCQRVVCRIPACRNARASGRSPGHASQAACGGCVCMQWLRG